MSGGYCFSYHSKDVPTHVAPPHDMSKVMPPALFSNIFLDVLLSVTIVFRMLTLLSINPRVSIIGSRMRRQGCPSFTV